MPTRLMNTLAVRSVTSAVPAFQPSDVAGLIAWYAADTLSLSDSDPVAAWPDISASGYNLTAAGGARPTFKNPIVNGKPIVRFNGSSNAMSSGNIAAVTDDYCQFLVINITGGSNMYILDPDISSTSQTLVAGFEANMLEAYNTPRVNVGTYDGTNFAVYEVNDDNVNRTGYKNGTQTEQVVSAAGDDVAGGAPLWLGSIKGGLSNWITGDIAELIWYGNSVSSGDRSDIRLYLGTKYGITVT